MLSAEMKREISDANRRRYEELRAAGQEATPKGLPDATSLDAAPIAPEALISSEEVPADWYTTVRQLRGHRQGAVECRALEGARYPFGHGTGVRVDRRGHLWHT